MKNHLLLAVLCLMALCCGCTKTTGLPKQLEAQIAAGDTIPASGLKNLYVIEGAVIAPDMLSKGLFVLPPNVGSTGAPDSELYIVMDKGNRIAVTKKEAISLLFPDATEFIVDGNTVSESEFNRIPAALISEVTAENGGKTLRLTSRPDVNAPGIFHDVLDREVERVTKIGFNPLAPSDLVITDFSTYPDEMVVNIDGYIQTIETLRGMPKEDIGSIELTTYAGYPVVNVNTSTGNGTFVEPENMITLSEILATDDRAVYSVTYYRNGQISIINSIPETNKKEQELLYEEIETALDELTPTK